MKVQAENSEQMGRLLLAGSKLESFKARGTLAAYPESCYCDISAMYWPSTWGMRPSAIGSHPPMSLLTRRGTP